MPLRSRGICEGMKPVSEVTPIAQEEMARVRVRAGKMAGRRCRFDGTRFESSGSVAESRSSGFPPSHEPRIFPVVGRGRSGEDHRQLGTEAGGIQARRPARIKRKCEQTSRANPYKPALGLLTHPDRQLSGAAHWGRSAKI